VAVGLPMQMLWHVMLSVNCPHTGQLQMTNFEDCRTAVAAPEPFMSLPGEHLYSLLQTALQFHAEGSNATADAAGNMLAELDCIVECGLALFTLCSSPPHLGVAPQNVTLTLTALPAAA